MQARGEVKAMSHDQAVERLREGIKAIDEAVTADPSLREPMLQWFTSSHLVDELRPVSQQFEQLALFVVERCPRNVERTVALRKLLEGKDAAVRSMLSKPFPPAVTG